MNLITVLTQELDSLEVNFTEQLSRLKFLEQQTLSNIVSLRKILQLRFDRQWENQLPNVMDLLVEVRKSIEQMENVSTPELEEIQYEDIEGISNEDVL
jgi:hypothetical protein